MLYFYYDLAYPGSLQAAIQYRLHMLGIILENRIFVNETRKVEKRPFVHLVNCPNNFSGNWAKYSLNFF